MKKEQPHPVDIHVGRRLRSRRTILGLSQEELGNAVGITFQQIQKYERGSNRIGSSRLYQFAQILGVSASYFFEDYEGEEGAAVSVTLEGRLPFDCPGSDSQEVLSLVHAFYAINDTGVRKSLLVMMQALANVSSVNAQRASAVRKKAEQIGA